MKGKNQIMLTENEKKMIENIINSEYDAGLHAMPWVFAVQDGYVTGNKFGNQEYKGVLGSLVKKGLVQIQNSEDGNDPNNNFCYLTNTGKEIAKKLYAGKYDWM